MVLQQKLEHIALRLDGTLGLAVHVPKTSEHFAIKEHELFPMASVFKIPLLVHLFAQVEAGALTLTERVEVRADAQSPGTGVLKELLPGALLCIRDLAMLMTIVSDNTATDLLYDRLGGSAAINATLRHLGLRNTAVCFDCKGLLNLCVGLDPADRRPETLAATRERLRQSQFDYAGPGFTETLENSCSTPADTAQLFTMIESHGAGSASACDQMIDILLRQQLNERIPLLLPRPFKVAHKTGTLGPIRNDAGIIYLPNGDPVVFCAYTKHVDPQQWRQTDLCIAKAALAVYEAYA